MQRRYGIAVDPATQVLPVNGSREALFPLPRPSSTPRSPAPRPSCPNPFYQIYEGATPAGRRHARTTRPATRPATLRSTGTACRRAWASAPSCCFVCSPGNPTGAVMPLAEWEKLFALSDRHGFVIASDECYSEIYFRDEPAAWAAWKLRPSWAAATSRTWSPSPACPSAATCPACAAALWPVMRQLHQVLPALPHLPRQRHGPADAAAPASPPGSDEAHVEHNRALYREKFAAVMPILAAVMDVRLPDAGFYLWAPQCPTLWA